MHIFWSSYHRGRDCFSKNESDILAYYANSFKVHILKNLFQKIVKITVQMPNNHLYNSKKLRIGYYFFLIIPLLIFLIAKFLNIFCVTKILFINRRSDS